mmetsp:Transcript_45368/g.120315  ORF Transcript_45368/g.120315 Transcript_45368/m.120315 type:complete len:207 (-) Transcript_45368:24-644(-)
MRQETREAVHPETLQAAERAPTSQAAPAVPHGRPPVAGGTAHNEQHTEQHADVAEVPAGVAEAARTGTCWAELLVVEALVRAELPVRSVLVDMGSLKVAVPDRIVPAAAVHSVASTAHTEQAAPVRIARGAGSTAAGNAVGSTVSCTEPAALVSCLPIAPAEEPAAVAAEPHPSRSLRFKPQLGWQHQCGRDDDPSWTSQQKHCAT